MDYEKLHKDTINRLQQMVSCGKITVEVARGICQDFEQESEDERIRKNLIWGFKNLPEETFASISISNIIIWLEKQGEKTSDKIVEKARTEKQRILLTETDGSANIDWDCRSLDDVKLLLEHGLNYIKKLEKQGEQKPNSCENCNIATNNCQNFPCTIRDSKQKPAEWNKNDEVLLDETLHFIREFQQSDKCIDESDMQNSVTCENWLKSLKDRVQPKPNQEWSKEDERYLSYAIHAVEDILGNNGKNTVSWLKSLRPQTTWKPSDEQMEALANALSLAKNCGEESAFDLRTLYEQLNKLKGK